MEWKNVLDLFSQAGLGALVLSADGIVLYINAKGSSLLGKEQKILGHPLPSFAIPLLQPLEEDLYCSAAFGKILRRCPTPLLEDFPIGHHLLLFRDATKEAAYKQCRIILNTLREGIVACDAKGRITFLNKAAAKLDALLESQVIGKTVEEVYKKLNSQEFLLPQVVKTRKPLQNIHQHYATTYGKTVDNLSNCYPLLHNGQMLGAFNVVEDWSRMDALQKKILDLQQQLLRSTPKAKEKGPSPSALRARYDFSQIIGTSASMQELIRRAQQVAQSESPVLIYGETGTGKELIAQSIHNASRRKNGPFLAINCAAIPENLLEGILFGTEKGAYTNAETRPGLFEQANGGTLLLDEINSMDLGLQPKLLRVLQEGTLRRVGGTQERSINVRILSNMNISPQQALEGHKLRPDLFYRLGVVDLRVPPLRERKEDLMPLITSFLSRLNKKLGRSIKGVEPTVFSLFEAYSWPGNVRELQHAIEFAMNVLPAQQNRIDVQSLPDHIARYIPQASSAQVPARFSPLPTSRRSVREVERSLVDEALYQQEGNISAAARQLGISRQSLQYRIKRDHIDIRKYWTSTTSEPS